MKPENLGLLFCRLVAAAAILVALRGESAHAAEEPVMFILDASSSMQNAADGESKISQARDLIASVVESEAENRQLGLIAFGARETKSCGDIQTVAPLGAKEAAFRLALPRVDAKGQAPIAKSLESAVTAMSRANKSGIVILIADGADTCDADPCATARELKEKAPNITLHAIGFASSKSEKVEELSCVADAGGGRFTLVSGTEELNQAVAVALGDKKALARALSFGDGSGGPKRPTLSLASPLSALVAPGAGATPSQTPKIADVLAANVGAGLFKQRAFAPSNSTEPAAVTFSAVPADSMPPLSDGVVWRVFKTETDAAGAHPMVGESREAIPKFTLAPGDYIVHCAYGRAQTAKRIQIGGGATVEERLVLNAGALRLDAVVEDRGSAEERVIAEDQVSFAVYRGDPEATRENVLVAPFVRPGQAIRLTEGRYHVVSHYGDANAMVRTNVRVEAGRVTQARVYHKAARVTLRLLSGPAGEALANTSWKVLGPGGELVRESVGAFPSHILQSGDYTVVAEHDQHTYKSLVSVETGQDRDIEVIAQE